ncbi:hypothetical protein [Marinobacter sp.]|uniref:hypothetical protein n=1 Tax=Marinobacter sp. TaxID=50741 RepID=UPI00356ABA34
MTPADKDQALHTILAALRTYQGLGYGDPDNRPNDIHEIATNGGDQISMDAVGIAELCEMLNFGDLELTHKDDLTTDKGPFTVAQCDESSRLNIEVQGLGGVLLNRTGDGLVIDVTGQNEDNPVIGSLALLESDFSAESDEPQTGGRVMVPVTLNTFDAQGNQMDTQSMDLADHQVSDIIDHASQLVVVMRDMGAGNCGIEAFDQVYSQLEEAIVTADIVDPCDRPLPTLHLLD